MSLGSTLPVIVIGAGGHAKVIAEALCRSGHRINGFVSPDRVRGSEFFGHEVLGGDEAVFNFSPGEVFLANGLGAMPGSDRRHIVAGMYRDKGYRFTPVVHPEAVVASDVEYGEGVQIMARVVIQPGTVIGRDTIINTGSLVDHDCLIGEDCHLAPGVVCNGGISIGRFSFVGSGSTVIQGISIGENCVIGAGSIIYADVEDGTTFIQGRDRKR